VIQLHDPHRVATASDTHHGQGVISILYSAGSFEVINASQLLSEIEIPVVIVPRGNVSKT
jgi:hypothetical protein